jgi:hypothetical protein
VNLDNLVTGAVLLLLTYQQIAIIAGALATIIVWLTPSRAEPPIDPQWDHDYQQALADLGGGM